MRRPKPFTWSLAMCCLLLAGCATEMKFISSAETGCAPDEITISDIVVRFTMNTWTATCRGKRYRCIESGSLGGNKCTAFLE